MSHSPLSQDTHKGAIPLGVGDFLDRLPRTQTVRVGRVTVGLLGICTTSTPLSSAKKPKGVVFLDGVPVAKQAARELLPEAGELKQIIVIASMSVRVREQLVTQHVWTRSHARRCPAF